MFFTDPTDDICNRSHSHLTEHLFPLATFNFITQSSTIVSPETLPSIRLRDTAVYSNTHYTQAHSQSANAFSFYSPRKC